MSTSSITRVTVDEIETTRTEKLLAFVLAIFLVVGGIWIYHQLSQDWTAYTSSRAERAAIDRSDRADQAVYRAEVVRAQARQTLAYDREAYRTALEAKQPTARLARAYHRSDARYRLARDRYRAAQREAAAIAPAAERAQSHAERENERRSRHAARVEFVSRLLLVLLALAGSYLLLGLLRRRHSRYFPVALAAVGASAVLALVMAGDYTGDYVDVGQSGPILISVGGILMTLLAFWALQRYLRRRIPARRVRKHECPFCGYPAGDNRHCEGCGRTVFRECTACQGPRRVGTPHCATCGAA